MSAAADTQLNSYSTLFSLKGKVAVVTGGSRGLGLHAASGLIQAGCKKVFITSRKADACEEACKALNALPNPHGFAEPRAVPIAADIVKVSEIDRLVSEVGKVTDRVDILFANAGATWGAPFDKHDEKSWDKVMDLNVKSVFFCAQKFLPLLTKYATIADPARIITTGSVAGIGIGAVGNNGTPSYTTSKGAVIHLTKNLALELGPKNVRCNVIAPGFYPSKMANGLIAVSGGAAEMARQTPTQRLGEPEDIAGAVVYLASRASSHCNGTTIVLDGGKVLGSSKL